VLEALLARTGRDEPGDAAAKLNDFERFLRFHLAAWSAVSLSFRLLEPAGTPPAELVLRGVATALLAASVFAPSRLEPAARGLVAALVCGLAAASFPATSNHGLYGALLAVALLVLRGGGAPTTVGYLRATVLLVCFGAGLQKALHGTWWTGSFLAWEVWATLRFELGFGWLLSEDELARLLALPGDAVGAGPYRLPPGPALLASRAVVVGEIGLPLLALWDRTRRAAVLALFGLVAGFELVAHEVIFGGLFASLLALFFAPRIARRVFVAVAGVYLVRGAIFLATGGTWW
jgi:hypothetical protein